MNQALKGSLELDKKEESGKSKLLFHPKFKETVAALNSLKIKIPSMPEPQDWDLTLFPYPRDGKLVSTIEKIGSYSLDAGDGYKFLQENPRITAYDESIQKYQALEGSAYLTSHSLIIHNEQEYFPSCYITFYFYTRANVLTQQANSLSYAEEPEQQAKQDYVIDRNRFILENISDNTICFIDGPLVGGQVTSYTNKLNKELLLKGIIPIFFVKNSGSNLVINNLEEVKEKYNSDLHWAQTTLKSGQRTNFFIYTDEHNPENAKAFCYLKGYDNGTQRVELHTRTYQKYKNQINRILNLAYYLLLVQGNPKNPQLRSIAVAEMYARECLSLVNINQLVKNARIHATINETRFGRS